MCGFFCILCILLSALNTSHDLAAGMFAEKVLTTKSKADPLGRRCATGILARTSAADGSGREWRIVFNAGCVISAAGALHTPALLLRSKIRVNGNVGKNLRLHPATAVNGVFSKVHSQPRIVCRGMYSSAKDLTLAPCSEPKQAS